MQKDVHYYASYAFAVDGGIDSPLEMAWANQFADDSPRTGHTSTVAEFLLKGWSRESALRLAAFHFPPYLGEDAPRMTHPNSPVLQRVLTEARQSGDPFRLGLAWHLEQDSYSHAGFTAWREDANSVYPWWHYRSGLPNIGHLEAGPAPDIIHERWRNHQEDNRIEDNAIRFRYYFNGKFQMPDGDYRKRKAAIRRGYCLARYSCLEPPKNWETAFEHAAKLQWEIAADYMADIPEPQ